MCNISNLCFSALQSSYKQSQMHEVHKDGVMRNLQVLFDWVNLFCAGTDASVYSELKSLYF